MKKKMVATVISAFVLMSALPVMALTANATQVVQNVKQVNIPKGAVQPNAVGGGTITCQDSGNLVMDCPWNVLSTSRITYSNVYVIFSDNFRQNFSYPVNPAVSQIYNLAEDTVLYPGTYYASLEGSVTTLDGVYPLVSVKSASVNIQ